MKSMIDAFNTEPDWTWLNEPENNYARYYRRETKYGGGSLLNVVADRSTPLLKSIEDATTHGFYKF